MSRNSVNREPPPHGSVSTVLGYEKGESGGGKGGQEQEACTLYRNTLKLVVNGRGHSPTSGY